MSEDIASTDVLAQNKNSPPTPPTLPTFTPVPRAKDRSNGWKPEVQHAFIEALAETGSVRAACRRVRRADHGAYQLRRHPEAESFRAAWDAALDPGIRRIEDAAMDRALYGTEETIHYHGEHVATRRRYNERLVMFMLRNRAADRFGEHGAKGPDAIGRMEMDRLKKQWREEWEAERRAAEPVDEKDALDRLNAKLNRMQDCWYAQLSDRTRAAYEEYKRLEKLDEKEGYRWWEDPENQAYIKMGGRKKPEEDEEDEAPALPAPDEDETEAQDEGGRKGPRIIGLKDEGWYR